MWLFLPYQEKKFMYLYPLMFYNETKKQSQKIMKTICKEIVLIVLIFFLALNHLFGQQEISLYFIMNPFNTAYK